MRPSLLRKSARLFGLAWMVFVLACGLVLLAAGRAHGMISGSGRGVVYLLFAAMLPGVLAWRWGSRPRR